MTIPNLEPHCGSWIVKDRATGVAVMETFQRSVAEKINQSRYQVRTAHQHLVSLNNQPKEHTDDHNNHRSASGA